MRRLLQRRTQIVVIASCDPLNLTGLLDAGERVRASSGGRIAYRDGVPVAALEGEFLKPLVTLDAAVSAVVVGQLTGRAIPITSGFVGRPRHAIR